MGLITKTIMVRWERPTCTHYKNLGYSFTKIKDEFEIKVEDLTDGSHCRVDVECDNCGSLVNITWQTYKKYVKNNGSYYCKSCKTPEHIENFLKVRLQNSVSFEQWCIKNRKQDIISRWDYKLNKYKPSEVCYYTNNKYYFKCPRGIHNSELKNIQYLVGEHDHDNTIDCKACNSFAQWGIDNLGNDFLEKYWDYEKNTVNPWEIDYGSKKKVWIKCQEKDYHGSYLVICYHFTGMNCRCPFCLNKQIHPFDSLGVLFPQVLKIWSNKNNKSSYEYAPYSKQKVWWKCLDGKHKDYRRSIDNSSNRDFRCPECVRERDESILQEKVRLYLNEFDFIVFHEGKCNIIAKNPKTKRNLPYDNEVVELKLIIEVHGLQHYYETTGQWSKKNHLHYQKIKDRYKRMYAKSQGYEYLEIPYWKDDDKESWKKLIDDKIKEIKNKL